ncbi:MAG: type II secretion system secretin GspD [Alphaproteobacteria bacterium]|nr:type II secretion system secretin GspD [Alphaproteobacteria bacterium]
MRGGLLSLSAVLAGLAGLSGCAQLPPAETPGMVLEAIDEGAAARPSMRPPHEAPDISRSLGLPVEEVRYASESLAAADGADEIRRALPDSAEPLRLDFENAPLAEVARAILGDLLQLNYALYPGVGGTVTIHADVRADRLLGTLERILSMNDAALRWADGAYHVLPAAEAGRLGFRSIEGERVSVIPLDFLDVGTASELIQPLLRSATLVRADARYNFLVLTGSSEEIASVRETLARFDVSWLAQRSFALVTLSHAEPEELVEDLGQILSAGAGEGEGAGAGGAVHLFALPRLRGVLAVAPGAEAIRETRAWIHRLDQPTLGRVVRLHVYPVVSSRADRLVETLAAALGAETAETGTLDDLMDTEEGQLSDVTLSGGTESGDAAGETALGVLESGGAPPGLEPRQGQGRAFTYGGMRVVADPARESIVVFGSQKDYATLEPLLRQLDVPPRQVLIEATVAEVVLTDELRYGVEWFFRKRIGDIDVGSELDFTTSSGSALAQTGLTLSVANGAGSIEAVLQLLDQDSDVRVLATPHIFVTERETAQILVGDQVPVLTQTIDVIGDGDDRSVNSVEYRDTGVILRVSPRIGRDGLVSLALTQEVSQVRPNSITDLQSPTFTRRLLETKVSVPSGRTLFIGGLIQNASSASNGGVPLLKDAPLIGSLFSNTTDQRARTELIVLLRPVVLDDPNNPELINEELRQKIRLLRAQLAS